MSSARFCAIESYQAVNCLLVSVVLDRKPDSEIANESQTHGSAIFKR
jgi:hypothetical protein